MFLDNYLKSITYFFKRVQFQIKTWKNSIEISVAYESKPDRKHLFKRLLVFFNSALITILCIAILFFLFKNKDTLLTFFQTFKGKKTSHEAVLKKEERKKPATLKISKKGLPVPSKISSESSVTSIESTLVQKIPEIIKPTVKKVGLFNDTDTSDFFIIVANKAFKVMYVLQFHENKWYVVEEFDIAIGEQDGKKLFAGDKRTPEGQYFIIGRKEHSELSIIYGPLAYVLNYPNEEDRLAGRTGQGIWIHGTDPDSIPIDTKGCLEMKNSDLVELSKIIKKGIGTPVLIVDNPQLTDPTIAPDFLKCKTKREEILETYTIATAYFGDFIEKWKTAWESKNMIEYTTFYDTLQFKGQGLDWNGWRERKLRTFDLYDTISITISDLLVTDYSDQNAIVKFIQQYKTNLNSNEVAKKLALSKLNDEWKISSESTCLKEELLL